MLDNAQTCSNDPGADVSSCSSDSLSSESSSLESSSSDENDEIVDRATHSAPGIQCPVQPQPSLRDRLQAFIPQLQQANDQLGQADNNGRGDFELIAEDSSEEDEGYSSEAEDGPCIEMNLGLGVLEQVQDRSPDTDVSLSTAKTGLRKRGVDELGEHDIGAVGRLPAAAENSHKKQRQAKDQGSSKIQVVDDVQDLTRLNQ